MVPLMIRDTRKREVYSVFYCIMFWVIECCFIISILIDRRDCKFGNVKAGKCSDQQGRHTSNG